MNPNDQNPEQPTPESPLQPVTPVTPIATPVEQSIATPQTVTPVTPAEQPAPAFSTQTPITPVSPLSDQPSTPVQPQAPAVTPLDTAAPVAPALPAKTNKRLLFIIIGGIVLILIILGIIIAVALSHSKKTSSALSASDLAALDAADNASTSDTTTDTTPALTKTDKPVDQTLTNSDLGYTIHATDVVLAPFALPAKYAADNSDDTIVIVQYTVTSGGTYTGAPAPSDVQLVTSDGDTVNSTSLSNSDLQTAGYTSAQDTGPDLGKSETGYAAYWVPTKLASGSLSIQYKQLAVKVINGSSFDAKTLSAKLY